MSFGSNGHSVPTEIAYEPGTTRILSWGYDINPTDKRVIWFKLLLEDEEGNKQNSIPPGMVPQDVVRDYLKMLYTHAIEGLKCQTSADNSGVPL